MEGGLRELREHAVCIHTSSFWKFSCIPNTTENCLFCCRSNGGNMVKSCFSALSQEVDDPHPSLFLLLTSCVTWENKHFIVLLYKIYHIVTVSSDILYYLLRF